MAQPPAIDFLFVSALANSGQIKQQENGSHRMVLKGVNEIDWIRPEREAGSWSRKQLARKWKSLFSSTEPNVQATFLIKNVQQPTNFVMFKPRLKRKNSLSFKIKAVDKESEDQITGLVAKQLDNISLSIDNKITRPAYYQKLERTELNSANLSNTYIDGAEMADTDLNTTSMNSANLTDMLRLTCV